MVNKVQCTLVQALRFCTGRTAHTGRRRIALLFLDDGTRRVRCQPHAPPALCSWERHGTYCTGGWVGRSGQVQKISPNGIRSPDRPARSQSDVMDSVTNTSYLFVVRIHKAQFRVFLRHFVIYKRLFRALT